MAIYYVCPENNRPCGGTKNLYNHVDCLNDHGLEASIFHQKRGFRLTWFENETKVVHPPHVFNKDIDWLVFPEMYGLRISAAPPGLRKVIFNQNAYYTFSSYPINNDKPPTPYLDSDVMGVMVVSEDSKRYLEYSFPGLSVFRIHPAFSPAFSFSGTKKKQIAFMPRKHIEDARQVINILKYRGVLEGWQLITIQDMRESQLVQILSESAIFLSFGYPEGLGGPPAEAMICGCIVIGYHGQGCREYMTGPTCWPIDEGQTLKFAETVEEIVKRFDSDDRYLEQERENASREIVSSYSRAREEQDILDFWNSMMCKTSELSATVADQPTSVYFPESRELAWIPKLPGKFKKALGIDYGEVLKQKQPKSNLVICKYMFDLSATERLIDRIIAQYIKILTLAQKIKNRVLTRNRG